MNFQVEKAILVQVLQRIQSATEKKTTMPILNNCLIKASADGTVEFSATDLELSLWTKIEAQVITEGKSTASARKLLEIVREIPQNRISFESTRRGAGCSFKAGRSRFELSTIPAEDFPNINLYQDLPLQAVIPPSLGARCKRHSTVFRWKKKHFPPPGFFGILRKKTICGSYHRMGTGWPITRSLPERSPDLKLPERSLCPERRSRKFTVCLKKRPRRPLEWMTDRSCSNPEHVS